MTERIDPPAVGVVAAIDTASPTADASALVLRHRLTAQLGPLALDFLTTVDPPAPLRRSTWQSARHHHRPGIVDALVVDERVSDDDLRRSGLLHRETPPDLVVRTDLFERELAVLSLFESCLDPAALDARRRMLVHLGLLTEPPAPLRFPRSPLEPTLRPTDLYLLAQTTSDGHQEDDRVRAMASGRTEQSRDAEAEIERIAASIAGAGGSAVTVPTGRLRLLERRVEELEEHVTDANAAVAAAQRIADDALAREHVVLGRLDSMTLFEQLADDEAAT